MKRLILTLVVLMACASVSLAGGYGYNQTYSNGYYDQYGYWHYYYQQVANVLVIGVPINTTGAPFYYSVGDELREERIIKKVRDEIKKDLTVTPAESKQEPEQGKDSSPGPEEFKLVKGGGSKKSLSGRETEVDRKVLGIFKTSCIACHKPGASKPGVQLFTLDGNLFKINDQQKEQERRLAVYEQVKDGVMPKGKGKLNPQQIHTLKEWMLEVSK